MPIIPERIIKARKNIASILADRAAATKDHASKNSVLAAAAIKSAEQFAKEYEHTRAAEDKARQEAEKAGNFYVAAEPKLLLVVRIRGLKGVSPRARTILSLFRLRQSNNAVFIRSNKATMNALRLVEPYVTYGEPTLETVRNLLYKRGFGKINNQRIGIFDNTVIDAGLSKVGIQNIESLVHEIVTVGPHFKEANNFVWPFQLNHCKMSAKRWHFVEGGDYGCRGKYINDFVATML